MLNLNNPGEMNILEFSAHLPIQSIEVGAYYVIAR